MRILVTGAKGMPGLDLCLVLRSRHEVVGIDQEDADVTDLKVMYDLVADVQPDCVLHAAELRDVEQAESCPRLARRVNAIGTLHVAVAANQVNARFAYISTSDVFDGAKDSPYVEPDAPNPINVYGDTKYAGERAVTSLFENHFIFRTGWLFAPHGTNFVNTVIGMAQGKARLEAATDQIGTPTYSVDLAHAVNAALVAGVPGIYHVGNSGSCSRFEFASEILKQAGIRAPLRPTPLDRYSRSTRRPAYCALSSERLRQEVGYAMRPWREALGDCLARRESQATERIPQLASAVSAR